MANNRPPAAGKREWTAADEDLLKAVLKDNPTVRQAAAAIGWGETTVRKHATRLGHSFTNKSRGAQATAAARAVSAENRTADRKARLEALALNYIGDAEQLRERVYKQITYTSFNSYGQASWTQDEPTPADQLKLIQASGTALEKALKLIDREADGGKAQAFSLIDGLATQLGITLTTEQEPQEGAQ